jgi:uncharacterized membrane protein YphA (DoxX/SURF4 family)
MIDTLNTFADCSGGNEKEDKMKVKTILYWTTTTLIALETLAGGWVDLTHGRTEVFNGPRVTDVVTGLGYPVYVLAILGIWKIPGAITLVVPGFLRLKEWAYAGIVFELSAAAASHAICGTEAKLSHLWFCLVSRSRHGRFARQAVS